MSDPHNLATMRAAYARQQIGWPSTVRDCDPQLGPGWLPLDARQRLLMASRLGTPGSMTRQREIDKAYAYIETHYPQYLKQGV